MTGRVVKTNPSRFFVDLGEVRVCTARKGLKILVGDRVNVEKIDGTDVILSVEERKNYLVRPPVSNVDICFIVVAPEPAPDFLLVDKIIVNCHVEGITPIIVVNKSDIGSPDVREYEGIADIIYCSAATLQGIDRLKRTFEGKTACFAGQSAVGKSSLVNALTGKNNASVGDLARKIKRGRNTTRNTEIIPLTDGTYIVDTCGFSMLDVFNVSADELKLYYDEFEKFRGECRFLNCTHTTETQCGVKAHVGDGVGKGRYERYCKLYKTLKDNIRY